MGAPFLRRLILAAAVSVVCAAAAVIVTVQPEENADETEVEAVLIDDINLSTVTGIALKNADGAVPLMLYDGEILIIDGPTDTATDSSVMKAFAYRMAHMPALRNLGPVDELAPYGLEAPEAAVSVLTADGEVLRIFLGNEAPFDGGYYAKAENSPDLYLVDEVTARMFHYATDDFRQLDVLPRFGPDTMLKDLTRFALECGGTKLEGTGTVSNASVSYRLTRPFETVLDWETVANSIFDPLSGLNECRFVSVGEDPSIYGLYDDDACMVQVTLGGQSRTLHFSDAGDGTYYVCRDGCDQIVRVDAGLLAFLSLQPSDLVSESLYSVSAAGLSSVRIQAGELDMAAQISGAGEELHAEIGGGVLSRQQTLSLVQTVTMLPPAGTLTEEADITEEPLARLTFHLRSGAENVIEIIPVTDRFCAVIVDGSYGAVTYTSTVEEMIREVTAILRQL